MCNLYRMKSSPAEVAALFRALPDTGANFGEEVFPGYPGLVVVEGIARTMTWGFPLRLKTMKPTSKPKAVNNTRNDKLHTPMWKASFEKRRCLIPVTQWAEAEGESGKMTRTWYALRDVDLFAVAGIWRWSEEWGDVYSMVMVDGCAQMADVHDRMPVILQPEHWDQWTLGCPDEAMALVQTCNSTLAVDRSPDPWFKPRTAGSDRLI
jgi:putative SOS response-associated peptidase YedK